MKKVISCVLLMLVLTSNALALEVPTDTVVQNLNGSQQAIKTFTVSPEQDPAALIEEPFELEGYLYTFADIVKSENPVEEKRIHTEVITVETTKDDLALIQEQLKPTLEYDDGRFQGTLALDHTSLNTVAAGYATKNYTVTETKTIGQLDRNDMSYVPATTIKNGRTLSLANVEWQVTGTDLVGEALMPSSYQAIATYSAKASYNAATGYITTAEYVGDVTHEGIESILGIIISILGISNMKGNISSLHWYHRQRVSPDDVMPFGKRVGLGTLIIGIAIIVFGLFSLITYLTEIEVYTIIGAALLIPAVIVGLGLSLYAIIKYNKGLF